jgi:hypothetical protein
MNLKLPALLVCAVALAACEPTVPVAVARAPAVSAETELAQALVADSLKDPASAQFRGVESFILSTGDRVVCGEVNAKNSYGGYAGFSPFYVRHAGATVKRIYVDGPGGLSFAVDSCRDAKSGTLDIAQSEVSTG